MISLPGLFLAFAGTAMLAALVALWNSVRSAFGGGPGVLVETARDLPDHSQLVEEKHALLRAIKDLEYERAVGKIGDVDFARLDAAYRARAKQVLAALDRDVKPLYEEAERLIERARAGESEAEAGAGAKKKKKAAKPVPAAAPATEASAATEASPGAADGAAPEREIAADTEREHETAIESGPSMDEVLAGIRDGTITEAPAPPAHWPADAKKMWTTTIARALADRKNEQSDEDAST